LHRALGVEEVLHEPVDLALHPSLELVLLHLFRLRQFIQGGSVQVALLLLLVSSVEEGRQLNRNASALEVLRTGQVKLRGVGLGGLLHGEECLAEPILR